MGDQIDLLCDRFEMQWREGQQPQIETCLAELPGPRQAELFEALLLVELAYRGSRNEPIDRAAYDARFPAYKDRIDAALRRTPDQTAPQVLGDYELVKMLGQGGMGAVYKARHVRLERIVALKVLPKDRTADPQASPGSSGK